MLKEKLTITYNLDEVADSLDEGIKFLKEHDIDSAEIRTIDGKNIAKLTLEETEELKETLTKSGLSVSSIASPLFKWYSGDSVAKSEADLFGMSPYLSRDEKEKMIRKIIDQACILGTTKIRIFSGLKPDSEHHSLPEEESELLQYALVVAKEKGVQLMLENEPVCYISKIEEYIDIFTSGKYEGLRAWFDIANVYEEGEDITYSDLKTLAQYIDYLHVKDPEAPRVHKYKPLGQGYINYRRVFDMLEKTISNPLHMSIETHVKDDKWNASDISLTYLHKLLNTKRVSYALIGSGRVSQKHFAALKENDNCTLMGVYDIINEKTIKEAYEHDCTQYASYEDVLSDKLVDVVSICTPHDTHINLARAALESDKKVLCEKPLACNSSELQDYISTTDIQEKTHLVFQNRFNPAVKKFYEFEKSKLGEPQYISMTLRWWRDVDYYSDWHGSQEISGGPLITQAIHSLELVTHLASGSAVKKVSAIKLQTRDDITLPDIVAALVEFDNGLIANIEVCLATRENNLESSIFVVGSKGSMKVSGVALSEFVHPESSESKDSNHDGHYYGNGHSALYKTHSNYYLKNKDADIELLTRPRDVEPTLRLIESIDEALLGQ
ncbi:MAG: Gfo/Idh/MocA family oxidoreductase [Candidatus Pacebacteria bacterium]|nr:Gfo/Idh/MocA family oxidoreductase [Candidatus Paceibacterota bacterium]